MKNALFSMKSTKLGLAIALPICLAGCHKSGNDVVSSAAIGIDSSYTSGAPLGDTDSSFVSDDLVANSSFTSTVTITFGSTVTIDNPVGSTVAITETNGDVVITSTAKNVEYVLTGTTTSGSVKIYSDNKYKLSLNGVNITNNDGPAINIQSSKRAFIVVNDGTENTLTDAASYVTTPNEDSKGTFFSEGQLIFSGTGHLTIKGNYKHALCSDDYIRITEGTLTITGSASDGIHTNDAFIADGGTISITNAGSEGIECEEGYVTINAGNISVSSEKDAITASFDDATDNTVTCYMNVNGGTINVKSNSGNGLSSTRDLTISNGTVLCNSSNDGISAGTALYINSGYVYSYSTANDGIESKGTIAVAGGKIVSIGTGQESGFDCDKRQFTVTGGLLVGIGATTSAPDSTTSKVPSVILDGGGAGKIIQIQTADGKEALTFAAPAVEYSTLLFAGSKLTTGTTYKVFAGGSVASGTSFNGLYTSGTFSGGALSTSFTTSGIVTQKGGTVN